MFHKLNSLWLLLPELDMTIYTPRDDVICLRDGNMGQRISMHIASLIQLCRGESVQIDLLEL
tara:strand:- start:2705 stop:2890 length:186 start_codon:yes stop_codon:yes gene_type:complete